MREIRLHLREQFGDHGGDAAEEMRPEPILEPGRGGAFRHDAGGKARRIHRRQRRRPHQIDASAASAAMSAANRADNW